MVMTSKVLGCHVRISQVHSDLHGVGWQLTFYSLILITSEDDSFILNSKGLGEKWLDCEMKNEGERERRHCQEPGDRQRQHQASPPFGGGVGIQVLIHKSSFKSGHHTRVEDCEREVSGI